MFEFTSIGASNNALKLLERSGFDYDLAAVEEAVGLGKNGSAFSLGHKYLL